jgi:hypothetical protein
VDQPNVSEPIFEFLSGKGRPSCFGVHNPVRLGHHRLKQMAGVPLAVFEIVRVPKGIGINRRPKELSGRAQL